MNVVGRSRIGLVSLLIATLLAACGGSTSTGSTSATTAPTTGSMATTEATMAAMETATAASAETAAAEATADPFAGGISGTGAASGQPIKIGSKNFTEAIIVAELYALTLEKAGFTVERKFNLGATPIAHEALLKGDLDMYPEYNSTGLLTVLKESPLKTPAEIQAAVKQGYEQKYKLTWLDPSPFNDSQGLATTKEISDQYQIKTYSDLATKAAELRLGASPEFAEREDGIKGLQSTYGGYQFKEFKDLGTGVLRYDGLKGGQVDIIEVYTTDARISADNLVVLQDDKGLYPIYNIAPVIRQDTLAANPGIAEALNKLAPLLTDEVITQLNSRVDIDGEEIETVAQDFFDQSPLAN